MSRTERERSVPEGRERQRRVQGRQRQWRDHVNWRGVRSKSILARYFCIFSAHTQFNGREHVLHASVSHGEDCANSADGYYVGVTRAADWVRYVVVEVGQKSTLDYP